MRELSSIKIRSAGYVCRLKYYQGMLKMFLGHLRMLICVLLLTKAMHITLKMHVYCVF